MQKDHESSRTTQTTVHERVDPGPQSREETRATRVYPVPWSFSLEASLINPLNSRMNFQLKLI